ncbi:MAG: DUF2071 domain-containing protein [Planctomycetaceae bacterium]|nr:DUF2071 domain-containing protein [Planctomycetaceae bacterium]
MRIPVIHGVIDRRLLINFRVDPIVISRILPAPFRPQLFQGQAIAGICLIRLKRIRPQFFPLPFGLGSENAAHRIAVELEVGGQTQCGVYIPRRDTSSRLNAWAGGTVFPGEHHHAKFVVSESADRISVAVASRDQRVQIDVAGSIGTDLSATSLFPNLSAASDFFAQGAVGYSVTRDPGRYDGIELRCANWSVTPLNIERVASSYFDDRRVFPEGSIQFDCALLMRGIEHEWHGQEDLCCEVANRTGS